MNIRSFLATSVVAAFVATSAFAQVYPAANTAAGITVAPFPFNQTEKITITVDVTKTFPRTGDPTLKAATQLFIHSGVNIGAAGNNDTRWKHVVGAWRDYPKACQFTRRATPNTTFDLIMTPSEHYKAGDLASDAKISELCMVLNDGTGGKGEGKVGPETAPGDIFIPVGKTTSVKNSDVFTAASVYPNPSAQFANVSFGLKAGGAVSLRIVDVQGRTIRTLINNQVYAGNALNIIGWDLTNDAGQRVGNGSYFVRVEANGASETASMMVNR
jgi:hypothetical protein